MSKNKSHAPRVAPFGAGMIGAAASSRQANWKRANLLLALAVAVMALWLGYLIAVPTRIEAADGGGGRGVSAAPADNTAADRLDYRRHLLGKRLFAEPVQPPKGPNLAEEIAKAKAKVKLRAITQVNDKPAAYFEVRETTATGPRTPTSRTMLRSPRRPRTGTSIDLYFVGDLVGEFTITEIKPDAVTTTLNGAEVVFTL